MSFTLTFEKVPGPWSNVDYKSVFVTKISGSPAGPVYAYMGHLNLDYDGSPTAYGPPGVPHSDFLANAGPDPAKGWYGVVGLTPAKAAELRKKDPAHARPVIDERPHLKDALGQYPVIQQRGEPSPGNYVSQSSIADNSSFPLHDQRRYLDSSAFPFGALAGQLKKFGVELNDCGIAIRNDRSLQCPFAFKDAGPSSGRKSWSLGESSPRILTDLGGSGKNNSFQVSFLVFPGAQCGISSAGPEKMDFFAKRQILSMGRARNFDDLPMLLAMHGESGNQGQHPADAVRRYQAMDSTAKRAMHKPPCYHSLARSLQTWGFPALTQFLPAVPPLRAA